MAGHPRVLSPSRTPPKPTKDITLNEEKCEDLLKLQTTLEKEILKVFRGKDQCLQSSFVNYEDTLNHQRNTECLQLRQQINQIRSNISHFKRTLQDSKGGPKFVEKVKQTLEEIEASILSFKEKQRETYEQLLKEEITVYQEVLAYERRIESWLTNSSAKKINQVSHVGVSERSSSMPPAVLAFERFLSQTGGHTGGWEEFDHLTFVRIKRKHQGAESFLSAVATEVPTQSLEDIKQHDHWYTEYCTILETKKRAIDEWKNEKQKQASARRDETKAPQTSATKQSTRERLIQKEREERFAKLKEWKEQRVKIKQVEEREQEETMRENQRMMKQKELERQNLVKAELEEYSKLKEERNRKKQEEEEMKLKEEKWKSKVANKQIKKFRERDTLSLKERLERVSAQEQEQIEREKRLDKLKQTVAVNVSRDPSRLLRPTTGWTERRRAEEEHYEHTSGSILHVPRRAIPSWRQGL